MLNIVYPYLKDEERTLYDFLKRFRLQVDDVLESKLERRFELVMDEGTLDAIGLHPDGPVKR